jgi:hypothetical protein
MERTQIFVTDIDSIADPHAESNAILDTLVHHVDYR